MNQLVNSSATSAVSAPSRSRDVMSIDFILCHPVEEVSEDQEDDGVCEDHDEHCHHDACCMEETKSSGDIDSSDAFLLLSFAHNAGSPSSSASTSPSSVNERPAFPSPGFNYSPASSSAQSPESDGSSSFDFKPVRLASPAMKQISKGPVAQGDDKRWKCHICGRGFSQKSNYEVHIRVHTQEKPYICNFEGCGLGFISSTYLRAHMRGHLNIRPFVCEICQKAFTRSTNAHQHVRMVHRLKESIGFVRNLQKSQKNGSR
eukprot:GILI01001987.1.p1 GENE.GILI01001987.1~~GILI01001987.1.p1  ORF type:complete len:260 (+),score=52.16 GILI01001987.1:129-908(+)